MRKVALLFLILFSFGPPFIYGLVGAGLLASLGWSAGIAMFAVGTGWRLPEKRRSCVSLDWNVLRGGSTFADLFHRSLDR